MAKKMYERDCALVEMALYDGNKSADIKKCPRCKCKKLNWRLDGSRWCKRCGQRISSQGEILPSFDRRELKKDVKESIGGIDEKTRKALKDEEDDDSE